jgi:hypothetical protein
MWRRRAGGCACGSGRAGVRAAVVGGRRCVEVARGGVAVEQREVRIYFGRAGVTLGFSRDFWAKISLEWAENIVQIVSCI